MSDTPRVVDFTQARVNLIAQALDRMTDQMHATNLRLLALHEELGEFKSEVRDRFDRVDRRLELLDKRIRDAHSEVILLANQMLNAQRDANQALFQLADLREEQTRGAGEPESGDE
jgi:predicted  nucleic acid-binding Zn-ribbon protein